MSQKINIIQTEEIEFIAESIASKISDSLSEGRDVIWFVSGGSNIALSVAIRALLTVTSSSSLHICLIDERYGKVGHRNSNWQALMDAGFDFSNCSLHPILQNDLSADEVAEKYTETVTDIINNRAYVIAVFGLGYDGHTAGLLPFNPLMDGTRLYGAYRAKDFTRITVTPKFTEIPDEIILFVWNSNKAHALKAVLSDGSIDRIPGRILKDSAKLTVYTNIKIGGEANEN